jgi:hypothetical protein
MNKLKITMEKSDKLKDRYHFENSYIIFDNNVQKYIFRMQIVFITYFLIFKSARSLCGSTLLHVSTICFNVINEVIRMADVLEIE